MVCRFTNVRTGVIAVVCCCLLLASTRTSSSVVHGFVGRTNLNLNLNLNPNSIHHRSGARSLSLGGSVGKGTPAATPTDDPAVQWELMNKHHAKGSWKGIWTTYDYIGDVTDETVASVDLVPQRISGSSSNNQDNDADADADEVGFVDHTHTIVVGAKRSDCATCFDSMESRTLPVQRYTPENLPKRSRLAGVSMVNGPYVLRSGAMATELILKHGDGRVRATFHHAPVWEKGVEPGSCPPQGLKLFRATLSREALRATAPTVETEAADPPTDGNPVFFRPVPPFDWHKKWKGTSWTWGPQAGNRGWAVDDLDETDAWQGICPVECWNLRLPGGIHLQAPRIVTADTVGICRLAWLPTEEMLLRVEAGVAALQPMDVKDQAMVGFAPPSLTSQRCDMLKKVGELEDAPRPSRDWNADVDDDDDDKDNAENTAETLESLQNTLSLIEAVEERNTAQLDSFVDKDAQWESLEPYERDLLSSKEEVVKRLAELYDADDDSSDDQPTKESKTSTKTPDDPPATPRDFLSL